MIIGLSGKKRAGKDSLAEHLIRNHGFIKVAFADPLRDITYDLNPWIVGVNRRKARLQTLYTKCGGWEGIKAEDNWSGEVRRIMQVLGVSVRDNVGPETWVNAAMERVREFVADNIPVVMTDMRFPNEVEIVRSNGGLIVRIERDSLPAESLKDQHVSETLLDNMSILRPELIINSDPFHDFHARAERELNLIKTVAV